MARHTRSPSWARLATAVVVGAFAAVLASAAGAQTPQPYPSPSQSPSPTPTNQAGSASVLGETLSACGFAPGASVQVTADGQPAGSTSADGSGCASARPALSPGSHQACLIGPKAGGGTLTACGTINVAAAAAQAGAGLPRTGANISLWVIVGALLLATGGVTTLATRRRRVRT